MILEPHRAQALRRRNCSKDWQGNEKKIQRHGRAKPTQGQSWESWKGNSRMNEGMVLLEGTSHMLEFYELQKFGSD